MSAFDRYPDTMPDVLSVRFHERDEHVALSTWVVLLNGSELTWTERDEFEPCGRIVFDQTDGDLEVFRGQWVLEPEGDGVVVALDVEFDLGIPSLAPVLDPIGIQAIRKNTQRMLGASAPSSRDRVAPPGHRRHGRAGLGPGPAAGRHRRRGRRRSCCSVAPAPRPGPTPGS